MSAVSNSVMPRSIALWITLREVSRSVRWPKLLQPRPTAETRRPELPRLRISMDHPKDGWRKRRHIDPAATARKAGADAKRRRKWQGCEKEGDKKVRPRSDAAT